jgi:arginyl-tRNA synthetase
MPELTFWERNSVMSAGVAVSTIDELETFTQEAIREALAAEGAAWKGPIDLRPLPFEGQWGVASSVSHAVAGQVVQEELSRSAELDGLSKKAAKQVVSERARTAAQALAERVAARLQATGRFAAVESANGFVNVSFDPNQVATGLIAEILEKREDYGQAQPLSERVMVEHSQPNTHKVFHIGHLRNTVLGIAVSNVLAKAGYPVTQATYPGDIGMHVIKALWCYDRFHRGQEPKEPALRGRWMGEIYAESDARLEFRNDVLAFVNAVIKEDQQLATGIDLSLIHI